MPRPLSQPDAPRLSFPEMQAMLAPVDPNAKPQEWSRQRHAEWVRQVFTEAADREMGGPEHNLLARVLYAWRLTREMAILRGLIAADEPLTALMDREDGRCWAVPEPFRRAGGSLSRAHASPEALGAMEAAEIMPDGCGQWYEEDRREVKGLALVPPEPPVMYWREDEDGHRALQPAYEPSSDRLLIIWVRILNSLSTAMGLGQGEIPEEFHPIRGLYPLLDIETCRELWPDRTQIIFFEQAVIEQLETLIVRNSLLQTKRIIRERFGLLPYEIDCLVRIVKAKCREMLSGDLEDHKALMVLKYEDFIGRCQESLDLNNEIKGLKALATALGIHKIQALDTMKDIMSLISEGAEKRRLERERNVAMLEGPDKDETDTPFVGRREIVAEQRRIE